MDILGRATKKRETTRGKRRRRAGGWKYTLAMRRASAPGRLQSLAVLVIPLYTKALCSDPQRCLFRSLGALRVGPPLSSALGCGRPLEPRREAVAMSPAASPPHSPRRWTEFTRSSTYSSPFESSRVGRPRTSLRRSSFRSTSQFSTSAALLGAQNRPKHVLSREECRE